MFNILKHDVDEQTIEDVPSDDLEKARKMVENELRPVSARNLSPI